MCGPLVWEIHFSQLWAITLMCLLTNPTEIWTACFHSNWMKATILVQIWPIFLFTQLTIMEYATSWVCFWFYTVHYSDDSPGVGYFLPPSPLFSKRRLFSFCSQNGNYLVVMSRHNNFKLPPRTKRADHDPPSLTVLRGSPEPGYLRLAH